MLLFKRPSNLGLRLLSLVLALLLWFFVVFIKTGKIGLIPSL